MMQHCRTVPVPAADRQAFLLASGHVVDKRHCVTALLEAFLVERVQLDRTRLELDQGLVVARQYSYFSR